MKYTAHIHTKKIGSDCHAEFEIPDDELEGLSEMERDSLLSREATEALAGSSEFEIWWTEGWEE